MECKTAYRIVTTIQEVRDIVKYCKQTKVASVDYETSGQPIASQAFYPTILGVSFQPGFAYIIPLNHFDSPLKRQWKKALRIFAKGVWEDPTIMKVAWNLKFEWTIFYKYGYLGRGYLNDGMVGKYLLDEERPHGLKENVARFIPEWDDYENYEGSNLPWDSKPLEGLSKYCARDCDAALRLTLRFEDKLRENQLYPLFRNLLLPDIPVLGKMEYHGAEIDTVFLDNLIVKYSALIKEHELNLANHPVVKRYEKQVSKDRKRSIISRLKAEITEIEESGDPRGQTKINNRTQAISNIIAGAYTNNEQRAIDEPVNFGSPAQIVDLFFKHSHGFGFKVVKYTVDKKTKKPTNTPSTDEEVLLVLEKKDDSGFIKSLLELRGLSKLYSTYMVGIKEKLISTRVHTRFNLTTTVTGRLSSNDPNMQNIPRDTTAKDIKTMFIAPPGHLIMQVDYSQAELRVLAAAANETSMLADFNAGHDIHLASACKKHKWDYYEKLAILEAEDGSPEFIEVKKARKQAKTLNFGIVYGQGPKALSEGLECDVETAKVFLKQFNKQYPNIAKYIKRTHSFLRREGYVKSVFKRKRRLPGIWAEGDSNWGIRAKAERDAINAPIQGAASDFTQLSNIYIDRAINIGLLPPMDEFATVHDSLIYYIKPEHIHKAVPVIKEICRNPNTKEWFGFEINQVEMKVDFEIGLPWSKLHSYSPETDYTKLLQEYTITK